LLEPNLAAVSLDAESEPRYQLRIPRALAVAYELFRQVLLELCTEEEIGRSGMRLRNGSEQTSIQLSSKSEHSRFEGVATFLQLLLAQAIDQSDHHEPAD